MARSPANLITAAALLGLPAAGFALGLGDIQLKSALNQPLDAQIEILGATPQDLRDLHATIAARDTFNRYGLDYPQMLGSFRFSVERGADGRDVLRVTSPQPVTEPFLTFLVEADWARGRLLREYTVLLDPPVFMPEQQTQVAVEAPRGAAAQPAPGAGRIERPAESAEPAAVERPAPPVHEAVAQPAAVAGGEYRVQRGDTLWVIASQTKPDASISQNQMMVALYRNNPDAFLGNMNLVKEGALLHVPSSSEINALPSGDANAEVSRQANEWRGGAAVAHAAGSESQLKLVPPKAGAEGGESSAHTSAGTSAGSAGGTAEARDAAARAEQRSASLSAENTDLKGQLDEARRLLAVKDAELAKMQQSLDSGASAQAPPAAPPGPGETGVNLESGQASPTKAEPAATSEPVETTAQKPVKSEPVSETPAAKPVPAPAVAPAPAPEPEARTSWVAALFSHTWLWVAAGLALVLGAAGLALKRRRPQLAPLEALEEETPSAAGRVRIEPEFERTITEATPAATGSKPRVAPPLAAAAAGASDTGTFEITGTFRPVDFDTTGVPSGESEAYPFEDSGSALAIDQADPISEADFHMAYGLYDQASDLIKKALDREPAREDLQLKLLEILFMWSNKDAFRQQAQAFRADLTRGGQWDKIVIMGKQLCPGDALFDAAPGLSADGSVDLDFAPSKMAAPAVRPGATPAPGADSQSLDLDLDDALTARADLHSAETVPATGEYLELARKEEPEEVEVHDEQLTAVARRLEARMRPRAGDVGVALDLGETIAPEDVSATRTLTEQKSGKKSDDDAFGDFFAFTGVAEAPEPDPTGTREVVLDFEGDLLPDSTTAEFKIELPEDGSSIDLDVGATGVHLPKLGDGVEGGTTAMFVPSGDTTVVSSFGDTATMQAPGFVDPTARTVQAPRLGGLGGAFGGDPTVSSEALDFNIGESDGGESDRGSTLRVSPSELALPEADDGVLDEVGTKLDLARAYIDMGDPDGARSILEEVIEEGDESQRQNAHTLLRSIA